MTPSHSSLAAAARRALRALVPALMISIGLGSCQTAPDRSIPDPLPETLSWALPPSENTAFLGLEVRENDSGSLESLSFDPGVRVHQVIERSPAQGAGIRVDDVILEMDGVELAVPEDLDALLRKASGGSRVALKAQRGDTVFDIELTLGGKDAEAAPQVNETYVLDPARSRGAWGTSDGAVLVARADDAPVGKLPLGTRVVSLDGGAVASGRGLVARFINLGPGATVELGVVTPDGDEDTVKISLLDEGRRTTRFSIPVLATYTATPDRTREDFVLLDLYLISLFRYSREGKEKQWRILRFFQFASGVGELDE